MGIIVGKPYIKKESDQIFIYADITESETKRNLWFSTSLDNKEHLSLENCDAFFLTMFLYAFYNQKNIKFEHPVSKRLFYGVKTELMKALVIMNPTLKPIDISGPTTNIIYSDAEAVGTALSLGVDSFHAIANNMDGLYPVTHLTLFNAGAYGEKGGEDTRKLFFSMLNQVEKVADEMNLPIIWVDTNMNEILNYPFIRTHVFRNLACALLLQRLFRMYYYASGTPLQNFRFDPGDTMYFDYLVSKEVRTDYFEMRVDGPLETRVTKTEKLAELPITYTRLNVCNITTANSSIDADKVYFPNCSSCFKCIRTIVTLDILGKLGLYKEAFDLELYRKNKSKYIAGIIYQKFRNNDVFATEIYNKMKETNFKIPNQVYSELGKRTMQPIFKKLKLK